MGSTTLPALQTNPKFIFFTDFDGTITVQDSNDFLTDNLGYGAAERKKGNGDVLFGRRHFRDLFHEMLASISTPFDQCIATLLENIKLDPGFRAFFDWARANNVPVVVLSGGMEPIIRALLAHYLGEAEAATLQIVSNNVAALPGKSINDVDGWEIVFHDERYVCHDAMAREGLTRCSGFGHDKSLEIRPYANLPADQRPVLFYAGDGVSDLSAAKETDLLFAKAGRGMLPAATSSSLLTSRPRNVLRKRACAFHNVQRLLRDSRHRQGHRRGQAQRQGCCHGEKVDTTQYPRNRPIDKSLAVISLSFSNC